MPAIRARSSSYDDLPTALSHGTAVVHAAGVWCQTHPLTALALGLLSLFITLCVVSMVKSGVCGGDRGNNDDGDHEPGWWWSTVFWSILGDQKPQRLRTAGSSAGSDRLRRQLRLHELGSLSAEDLGLLGGSASVESERTRRRQRDAYLMGLDWEEQRVMGPAAGALYYRDLEKQYERDGRSSSESDSDSDDVSVADLSADGRGRKFLVWSSSQTSLASMESSSSSSSSSPRSEPSPRSSPASPYWDFQDVVQQRSRDLLRQHQEEQGRRRSRTGETIEQPQLTVVTEWTDRRP